MTEVKETKKDYKADIASMLEGLLKNKSQTMTVAQVAVMLTNAFVEFESQTAKSTEGPFSAETLKNKEPSTVFNMATFACYSMLLKVLHSVAENSATPEGQA